MNRAATVDMSIEKPCEHGVDPYPDCDVPCSWCDRPCGEHQPWWPECPEVEL